MANKMLTVFQNLDKVISGNWDANNDSKHNNNTYDLSKGNGNNVIYKTDNKADYEKTKLELQQNSYLNDRWVKANVNLSVQAFSGLNNVKLMYRDADLMDAFPEIGTALDIISEECSVLSPKGQIVNVYSKSDRIKNVLEELFTNRLDLQVTAPMIIRGMCKYGNQFMMLNIDNKLGITGWRQLPVFNVERLENGIRNQYSSYAIASNSSNNNDLSTKFVWQDEQNSQVPFRNWQIGHFRLLTDSLYLPYGCLVGDTRIETEYGYKEMSDIEIGDKVWTFNIEKQERELATVTMFMPKGKKDVYRLNTEHTFIEGTFDHKLLINANGEQKYKEIGEIKVGDLLVVKNNEEIIYDTVTEISYNGEKETYDFTVRNDNSNFFANGIVTHNCSYLNKARRHWRMLSLMEDLMLIYRLERSIERRVYKIYVGAIDDADVKAYVEDIANNFKRTPVVDPMTGQIDLRKNLLDVSQDLFIPVRDPNAPTPIDTLSAAQNLTAMDDIKFVQNKVLTALRIPKSFLNFEETTGDGKNLSLMDIRFTRTVNRIQQAFLMELTKIASIHLYILGFTDELTNFSLSMNNPSTQAEQLEIDNIQKKITAIRDAVSDPGNGIPIMSQTRALKEIMKWSDKDIQNNLEEIRLEKAVATELEKTSQIIKKTGIFDTVDRVYGEPGAEYQEGQDMEGADDMSQAGGGGGGFGGGMDIGDASSDADQTDADVDALGDMGTDDASDINGNESEIPISDNEQPKNESKLKRKKPLNESKKKLDEFFLERFNKRNETVIERTDVYDKALMINEDFNDIIKSLDGIKS